DPRGRPRPLRQRRTAFRGTQLPHLSNRGRAPRGADAPTTRVRAGRVNGRGLAGLAVAGVAVCCGVPLVLAAGSAVTVAGVGLRSWLLVAAGCVTGAAGLWRWRVHRRSAGPRW